MEGCCGLTQMPQRYDNTYLQCSAAQQKEILDLIAYRANGENPSLMPGVMYFALLRELTVDGYFTSKSELLT